MTKPRIGVTMGDPAGVGPEICLDLLADSSIADRCTPIVFGDAEVLRLCRAHGQSLKLPNDLQGEPDYNRLAFRSRPRINGLGTT